MTTRRVAGRKVPNRKPQANKSSARGKSGASSGKSKEPRDYRYKPEGTASTPSSLYDAPVESSDPVTLVIERLADDGRGIAFEHGKTIFVDGTLDGETVTAVMTKRTGKFNEARVVSIEHASDERIEPPCPVFSRCGGCSVQHMPATKQLAFKQAAVLSQLSRWAGASPKSLLPTISGDEYTYRQRVRLAVDYSKVGEVFLGFREATSHRLVNVNACLVLESALQDCIPPLRQWLEALKPNVVGHIELVNTVNVVAVVVRHTRKLNTDDRQQLATLLPSVLIGFQGEKQAALENVNGDVIDPRMEYTLTLEQPLTLSFHPQDFVQSNAEVNRVMVTQALHLLAPKSHEHIVDLFCGVGNFSLAIAQQAGFVTGIEGVDTMVVRAQKNAQSNALDNTHFMVKDLASETLGPRTIVNNPLFDAPRPIDAMLLDPPRSGAKEICQKIREFLPKRIVYVSCDSSTFARDAKILIEKGYHFSQLGLMDMFPQTAHIELMALFTLTPGKPTKSRVKRQLKLR